MNSLDSFLLPDRGDKIIRTKPSAIKTHPKGVGYALYEEMTKNPNRIGQMDGETGKTETLGEMLKRAVKVATHLRRLGVKPGDVVTPCTTNHMNTSIVLYAIFFVGAVPACMDAFAPDDDRKKQLDMARPKFVFVSAVTLGKIERMIDELRLGAKLVVFENVDGYLCFDDFLTSTGEEDSFAPFETDSLFETAVIVFSSGTTGAPKGICIHHYCTFKFASDLCEYFIRPNQIALHYSTLVWIGGQMLCVSSVLHGHVKLIVSLYEREKTWKYLTERKVNVLFLAPENFNDMVRNGRPRHVQLPHLKIVCPIGGCVSLATVQESKSVFADARYSTCFGMSECGFVLAMDLTEEGINLLAEHPTTVGRPIPDAEYKIVDPDTNEILGRRQTGELLFKSKTVMNGYHEQDSSDRFDSDGFFRTGDLFYYDENRCFYYVSRLKEMLRYKFCAIAPAQLEEILMGHPSVARAYVLGIPTNDGDVVFAAVVRKDDEVTERELVEMVNRRVDERKRIRAGVKFVNEDEIPYTAYGKVKRVALRDYMIKNYTFHF